MLALFVFKSRASFWVLLRVFFSWHSKHFKIHSPFQLVFCNAVVIGSGIFQLTQGHVYSFVLTAFTSLVILVELCTSLCCKEFQSSSSSLVRHFVCPSSKSEQLTIIFNLTVLHSISLSAFNFTFCTDWINCRIA